MGIERSQELKDAHAQYMRDWRAGKVAPRRTREHRKEVLHDTSTIDAPLPQPAVEIPILNAPAHGLRIATVLDVQAKHGVPMSHLAAYGHYIAAKRPDVLLCIGDFWDMRSLNRHDAPGSKKRENQRYQRDIDAGKYAMDLLMDPIAREAGYSPMMVFLDGNHEDLITRYVDAHPEMEGKLSIEKDLHVHTWGWKRVPFLQPVVIGGVAFCHYFPGGKMGHPISKPEHLLSQLGMSCVAGHQQGRQIAWARRADGGERCAIISGSFYQHDEDYMSPLSNRHWRGTYFLNEVKDGSFAEMALTVNYLLRRHGK